MRRRYRFLRLIGADILSAAFIAVLNEFSDLPPNKVGFMTWVVDMDAHPLDNPFCAPQTHDTTTD